MAAWRETIRLNQVLAEMDEAHDLSRLEEPCPEEVREALAAEVEKSMFLARFAKLIRDAKSIAEVNRILERVYTDADTHRIWCGMA